MSVRKTKGAMRVFAEQWRGATPLEDLAAISRGGDKMLHIMIHNDGTGTKEIGNYNCSIYVNDKCVDRVRVLAHPRKEDWYALLQRMLKEVQRKDRRERERIRAALKRIGTDQSKLPLGMIQTGERGKLF